MGEEIGKVLEKSLKWQQVGPGMQAHQANT